MTRVHLLGPALVALASSPLRTLASSGAAVEPGFGAAEPTALLGLAAAYAWHHLARRRGNLVRRWQEMHLGERLPILRLGERLHALHLREALAAALHLRTEPRHGAPAHHPRRILVVDDDADIRDAIGEILSAEGFEVCQAADGLEGLRRAHDERPDVILLDLSMPGMDGFAFRAAQRTDPALAAIPVVVISASEPEQAHGIGAAAYLHKPFDLRVLLAAVDRCAVAA